MDLPLAGADPDLEDGDGRLTHSCTHCPRSLCQTCCHPSQVNRRSSALMVHSLYMHLRIIGRTDKNAIALFVHYIDLRDSMIYCHI